MNAIATLVLALSTLQGSVCGGSGAEVAKAQHERTITLAQAERIALERVPGGVVEDAERDRRQGRLVYEIDVRGPDGRGHDLVIDGIDGKVLEEETDD